MWVGELCQAEEMPEQNMVKGQGAMGLSSCEKKWHPAEMIQNLDFIQSLLVSINVMVNALQSGCRVT